jgi:hypothetical protein
MSGTGRYIHATMTTNSAIPERTSGTTSANYNFATTSVFENQSGNAASFDSRPTYGSYTLNSSGTNTANKDLTISGDVSVVSGILNVTASGTNTFTIGGNVSISSGASLQGSSTTGTGTLNITGNVTGAGTLTGNDASTGTANITVGGNLTSRISLSTGTTSLTFSGGAVSVTFTPGNGTTPTVQNLTIGNGTNSKVVTLGANLSIASGKTMTVTNAATLDCGTKIISGAGAFTLSSGATFTIGDANGITASAASGNIQVTGTRTFSSGANYNYNGSGAQATGDGLTAGNNITIQDTGGIVTLTTGVAVNGTFNVNSSTTFHAGTNILSGGGVFNLSSGGTLGIGSVDGIASSGATGNVQTGTRNFNTGASYVYNGSGAQITGNGLPSTVNNLTISNGVGVTLSASTTVNGTMTLSSGTLSIGTNTLTLNSTVTASSGSLSAASGTVIYNQSSTGQAVLAANYGTLQFSNFNKTLPPSGTIGIANTFTPGTATGHTITGSTIDFNGSGTETIPAFSYNNLTSSNSGNRTLANGGTIKIAGTFTPGINTYDVSNNTVEFNGASAQTMSSSVSFTYNNLTINNSAGVTVGTVVAGTTTVNGTLTLTTGALTNGVNNTLTLGNGATIIRSGGTLAAVPIFSGTVDVQYTGSSSLTTGPELPTSNTALNNLTINTSGGVTLDANATVNGTLALTNGDLNTTDSFVLTQKGDSTGNGDVVGSVTRADLTTSAKPFGNPNVQITITAGTVTSMTVKLTKGTTFSSFTNSVKRQYILTPDSGLVTAATVRLHYLNSEVNLNSESTLVLWRYDGSSWGMPVGVTTRNDAGASDDNWVELTGVTQFSPWAISGPQQPTDVAMMNFKAVSDAQGNVLLEWLTGYEVNNLGFNIYRDAGGKRVQINSTLVAGSVMLAGRTAMTAGLSYAWLDHLASPRDNVLYWLEDIDASGKTTLHGPVSPASVAKLPERAQSLLLSQMQTGATNPNAERTLRPVVATAKLVPAPRDLQKQWEIAVRPGAKLLIKESGWYRVTQAELAAAGFDTSKDPRFYQLFVDGTELPILVNGGNSGRLDAADSIEFYAAAIDSPSTNLRALYLTVGQQPGRRLTQLPFADGKDYGRLSFTASVERRDHYLYFPSLNNGEAENWFGALVSSNPFGPSLSLTKVDQQSAEPATLEVALQGLGAASPPQPHQVRVQLNGQDVGQISFDGPQHQVAQFAVSPSLLQEGSNSLLLTSMAGSGDYSVVDWVRVSYARRFIAEQNRLQVTARQGEQVQVSGFTTAAVRVMDVTDEANPVELGAKVELANRSYVATATPQEAGERVLLFVGDKAIAKAAQVVQQVGSSWHLSSQGADVVMLTHASLRSAVGPLAELRKQQGYAVAVVDVEDVYDEWSYGVHTAQAVQDFIAATRQWKRVPRWVVVVGDASYDPKNYLGLGENDLVPTKVVWTNTFETASDDWLGDVNGDGVSEVAIGRLPVRTLAQAQAVINKIINYKAGNAEGALLVADRPDGYDFEGATAEVKGLLPAGMRSAVIYRRQTDDQTAAQAIIDAVNRGPKLVNYAGHGSSSVWRGNLLTVDSVAQMTNGQALPMVVSMTCLNGLFNDPYATSLGESLLLNGQGGAIAVWASSAQTTPSGQAVMDQEFVRQLFQATSSKGQALTLGEMVMRAKAAVNDVNVRRSWILLGDPLMQIR